MEKWKNGNMLECSIANTIMFSFDCFWQRLCDWGLYEGRTCMDCKQSAACAHVLSSRSKATRCFQNATPAARVLGATRCQSVPLGAHLRDGVLSGTMGLCATRWVA